MGFSSLLHKVKYDRDDEKEYLVKAAMLVKFHQHTKWPTSANAGDGKTVNICVTGENPFSAKAQSVFSLASNMEVRYKFIKGDAYKRTFCHIVYVGQCNEKKAEGIVKALASVPSLTVSDIPGFAEMGGNIELTVVGKDGDKDQKVKLIINEQAALEKGLIFGREMKQQTVSKMIRKSN
jgi:hypothetical protein